MNNLIQPKNILILGATSKIAIELGRIYADANTHFILSGRKEEQLKDIAIDLVSIGAASTEILICDFEQEKQIEDLWEKLKKIESIDLIIMAHGTLPDQNEVEKNYQLMTKHIQINFLSYLHLLTNITLKLEEQKFGHLVVITSVAGDRGRRSNYFYGSLKGGLSIFLSGLRARLSQSNCYLTDVRPGFIETPMTAQLKKGMLFTQASEAAEIIKNGIEAKKSVIYVPFFWFFIMTIIKLIPTKIFNKLKF